MATCPLKQWCTSPPLSHFLKKWSLLESSVPCCFNGKRGIKGGMKRGSNPYVGTSSRIFINGCQVLQSSRENEGAFSFVPSTMPPTSDSESQGCLFMLCVSSIINPSSLPQPRSGVVKRGGLLIWRLHRAASLRGTMRSDPTHSPQGESPRGPQSLTFGPWFPGGSSWLGSPVYTAPLQDSPQLHWTPDTARSSHWREKEKCFPVAIYTLFLSPATYFFHSLWGWTQGTISNWETET